MKKSLLIAVAALFVALGANAQVKRVANVKKVANLQEAQKLTVNGKGAMATAPAEFKSPAVKPAFANVKKGLHKAAADLVGTYIMDSGNWDRDFTLSHSFTIEEENGTITLDEDLYGEATSFDYNLKLISFTDSHATAYAYYDEAEGQIYIPVQTLFSYGDYGRIVFSALVLDAEDEPLDYGYGMTLNVNADGSLELDEGDFSELAAEYEEFVGAYFGGFWNFMPDYLTSSGNPYQWNMGLDMEVFAPNAFIRNQEVHIVSGGWGDWAWSDGYDAYVKDYSTEWVVSNFLGQAPISITVDDSNYRIPFPQDLDDYDYSDDDGEFGRMRLWGLDPDGNWNTNITGTLDGVGFDDGEYKGICFYETEYRDENYDGSGSYDAGWYYVDSEIFLCSTAKIEGQGAYWWGEARFLDIIVDPSINVNVPETGIHGLTATPNTNAQVYDLQGRAVDSNYKGVVIQNGKKFVIK